MRTSIYVCLAALTAALAGCFWAPGDGYRGDRNGGYGGGHENAWNQGRTSDDHMNHSSHSNDQGAYESGQREGW
jgi:hypothetical protein